MKHKGSVCDFSADRNEELKRIFRREFMKKEHLTVDSAIEAVWRSSASRFYVSEQRARAVLRYRRRHGVFPGIVSGRLEMYKELWRRFEEGMERDPGKEEDDLIYEVVNSPAPSFYLSKRTMRTLLYKLCS